MRIPAVLTGGLALTSILVVGFSILQHSSDAATDPAQSRMTDGRNAGFSEAGLSPIEVERGFQIAPVSLNLTGKSRAFVGWGSYIVNAQGACSECHTSPPFIEGGNPFEGQPERVNTARYLAGGEQFGPVVSRNITPYLNGMPAGLTFPQFLNLLRTGKDEDGHILQVMPWPVYRKMTDRDLYAVYEYLRAVPPISPTDGEPVPAPTP